MATLTRWAPFHDAWRLQEEVNRLFNLTSRGYSDEGESLTNGWVPPVDIYEDSEGVTLRAEVPGLDAKDFDVRIENGTLTLKGERKLEREETKENYRRLERHYGAFSRSFSLPPTVDTEKIRAESKNGVLSLFLPKREETKPRQIRVNVN